MNKSYVRLYLFLIAVLVGFAITIQFKVTLPFQGIITLPKLMEMKDEIANIQREIQIIGEATADITEKLGEYEKNLEETGNIYDTMERELEIARSLANMDTIEGPGIIINVQDSTNPLGDNESISDLLVHDEDILNLINELKAAGAEAISFNDVRVTATSEFRCGGPIIIIDGERVVAPFIIKAIGDPNTLEATMLSNASSVQLLEAFGIRIHIIKTDYMVIKGSKVNNFKYLKKAEDGETK